MVSKNISNSPDQPNVTNNSPEVSDDDSFGKTRSTHKSSLTIDRLSKEPRTDFLWKSFLSLNIESWLSNETSDKWIMPDCQVVKQLMTQSDWFILFKCDCHKYCSIIDDFYDRMLFSTFIICSFCNILTSNLTESVVAAIASSVRCSTMTFFSSSEKQSLETITTDPQADKDNKSEFWFLPMTVMMSSMLVFLDVKMAFLISGM